MSEPDTDGRRSGHLATLCAAATVSPEPGLPYQPITEGSQNTCLDPGVEDFDSLLLDNEDKCRVGSADHNLSVSKLGLGHRGVDHRLRLFLTVSLQLSSMFETNGGCLKHFVEFFRSRSLRESVSNEPRIWDCLSFMDQHSGLQNSILREFWRIKWK